VSAIPGQRGVSPWEVPAIRWSVLQPAASDMGCHHDAIHKVGLVSFLGENNVGEIALNRSICVKSEVVEILNLRC
jgi:hypothetical protein